MMHTQAELQRDLVLVGGGHSHALALRMLAMQPIPVRVMRKHLDHLAHFQRKISYQPVHGVVYVFKHVLMTH